LESLSSKNKNSLYQILPGSIPIIIGDRSLTTYGKRILKGLRARESGWPLPGVYSPVDLATRILQKHSLLRPAMSELEVFARISEQLPLLPLQEIYDDYVNAKNLRKIVGYDEAARILSENELSDKSKGALFILLFIKEFGQGSVMHPFDILEKACALLNEDKNLTALSFHTAEPTTSLYLLGFRELYPLETKFINLLEKKFTVNRQMNALEDVPAELREKIKLGTEQIAKRKQIFWANDLNFPGPLEAKLLSGSLTNVRLNVAADLRFFSPTIERLRKKWINPKVDFPELQSALTDDDSKSVKILLDRIHSERDLSGFSFLNSLGFFQRSSFPDDTNERNLPLAKSPSDPVLLSLEDLPLADPELTALWTESSKLSECVADFCSGLNPLKKFQDLEKAILAEGISPPRIQEEQKNFEALYYNLAPAFKILSSPTLTEWSTVPQYEIKTEISQKMLSPSGLENLYKCTLNFHFQRELRLNQFELEDDIKVSPLRRGNWIHYTLESLNWQNPKKITQEQVRTALIKNVSKAFEKKASPEYLKIIEAQAGAMSESLFHYIQHIDIPTFESLPGRQSKSELDISTEWTKGITLRGRVDRMDFVGDGAFLWDYKSGNYSRSRLAKHLEDGKFQWLLYREIFNREGTPIHGGGYINPIDLRKSRLFFFRSAPLKAHFFDRLEQSRIPFEQVSEQDEIQLQKTLVEKVSALIDVWQSGIRTAKPRDKNECDNCSFVGLCGYPYGVTP
jgi:hypothetical protein